jgi:hypothetical protein
VKSRVNRLLLPARVRHGYAGRRGYVMLVALVLIALLAVLGATTLSIAGVDQRIALHNRKHMMVVNTAHAGNEHARWQLQHEDPLDEGLDTGDTGGFFISKEEAEENFEGLNYVHNLGVYWVKATYQRCGNPPPGYSTEIGRSQFRSDYWSMKSTARMQDASFENINETQAITVILLRKVLQGTCKIR